MNTRHASIEALARAVAQSPDGIAVLTWEGKILYVNPAWVEMHGYSIDEIIGHRIQDIYPGEEMARHAAETVRRLAVQDSYAVELSHFKKDGTPFQAWLITTLLRDEKGNPNGFVLTARDVTEWNRLKAALENEKAQLKQLYERLREVNAFLHSQAIDLAVRNTDLDAFAHTVAHDLKNPLTSIMGYAEMLLDDYDFLSDAERREFLGYIAKQGVKMRQIVDELLLMSQLHKQEVILTSLDMRATVTEACSRLEKKRCERQATVHVPKNWPRVLGYPQWVEQVWVNYLSNAIKYGGESPGNLARLHRMRQWVCQILDEGQRRGPVERGTETAFSPLHPSPRRRSGRAWVGAFDCAANCGEMWRRSGRGERAGRGEHVLVYAAAGGGEMKRDGGDWEIRNWGLEIGLNESPIFNPFSHFTPPYTPGNQQKSEKHPTHHSAGPFEAGGNDASTRRRSPHCRRPMSPHPPGSPATPDCPPDQSQNPAFALVMQPVAVVSYGWQLGD